MTDTIDPHAEACRAYLQQTRALLVTGWIQGTPIFERDGRTSYCLIGAITQATKRTSFYSPICAILRASLSTGEFNLVDFNDTLNLVDFNDTPGRKLEEVLALVDRAIEGCRRPVAPAVQEAST